MMTLLVIQKTKQAPQFCNQNTLLCNLSAVLSFFLSLFYKANSIILG